MYFSFRVQELNALAIDGEEGWSLLACIGDRLGRAKGIRRKERDIQKTEREGRGHKKKKDRGVTRVRGNVPPRCRRSVTRKVAALW